MDHRVERLKNPEDCEKFARNVGEEYPELARQARRRAVDLKALSYGPQPEVESEAIRAVYAYEAVLAAQSGKKIRASNTWKNIKDHGIIEAVARAVKRKPEANGLSILAKMDMLDYAFESVVKRHPDKFKPETVAQAKARLAEFKAIEKASG